MTEILNSLYNLMGLVFVLGTIISMGLSLTMKQITGPLRNGRFVVVAWFSQGIELVAFSSLRRTWPGHAAVRTIAGRPRRHLYPATSRAQRIADRRSGVPNESSILFSIDEVKNERCKRF